MGVLVLLAQATRLYLAVDPEAWCEAGSGEAIGVVGCELLRDAITPWNGISFVAWF